MRLKTIPIRVEDRFLSEKDLRKIWEEIRLDQPKRLVLAVDGAPGTGKSEFSKGLKKIVDRAGIQMGIVETDLDCLPWSERRPDSELMSWHTGTVSTEAIHYPGAQFLYTGYHPVSHKRDKTVRIESPEEGPLLIEGLHAIEYALQYTDGPVVAIPFEISNELRERRRAERNIREGRWKAEEVEGRTRAQRTSAVAYYRDLSHELRKTSNQIHNSIRIFK